MDSREDSGSLEERDLLETLSSLFEERGTGHLVLQKGNQVKSLYFRNGNIVFASSNQKGDRLGQILYRAGEISRTQLEELLAAIRKTGKRQGTVLIERGLLTRETLGNAITLQVKEILYSLLLWETGSYAFHSGEQPRQRIPVAIDTESLVKEMIKRLRKG